LGGLGSKGAIFFHCASVSNGPDRAIGPPSALLTLLMPYFAKHNHPLFRLWYQVVQQLLVFFRSCILAFLQERFEESKKFCLALELGLIELTELKEQRPEGLSSIDPAG
jgi:hypothetical protein